MEAFEKDLKEGTIKISEVSHRGRGGVFTTESQY
jgi:hypothetical protein